MNARQPGVAAGIVVACIAFSAIAQIRTGQEDRGQRGVERDVGSILIKRLYYSMTPLTYPERAMLYASQQAHVQMGLWQYHFNEFAKLHPHLTPEQSEVLAGFRTLTRDAGWFRIHEGDDGWEQKHAQVQSLRERGLAAFAFQDFVDGFVSLGPVYVPRPGMPDVPFIGTQECYCSTTSDYCFWLGTECVGGADIFACIPTASGCGTMGLYGCNGMCF